MNKEFALGIDIGGTNTVIGIVDISGTVHFEVSLVTNHFNTVNELASEIQLILEKNGFLKQLLGIGIGAPNGNCFSGTIDFAPNLSWKGIIPIVTVFKEQFQLPVYLANDANAAALGEHLFGCAHDLTDFVTITLGTGVGSGIFINNKLIEGAHGFAGEYGHIRVIPNGRLCGCGRYGCLETYTSSTGVVRSITEFESPNKDQSALFKLIKPSAKDVFDAAENGDLFALEIVDFTADLLGSSLADFAAFSDPQAYVLFGGIAQSGQLFEKKVNAAYQANALPFYKNTAIRISTLHNKNAAVLGTAATVFWKTK
jgi:glucokinase